MRSKFGVFTEYPVLVFLFLDGADIYRLDGKGADDAIIRSGFCASPDGTSEFKLKSRNRGVVQLSE